MNMNEAKMGGMTLSYEMKQNMRQICKYESKIEGRILFLTLWNISEASERKIESQKSFPRPPKWKLSLRNCFLGLRKEYWVSEIDS